MVKQIGRNGAPAQYPAQAMKKVRYPAEISRPVILARSKGFAVPDPNTTSGRKKIQEANKEMMRLHDEAIVQKLHLLMDHYKIQNKKDWFALARALAFDHVDGLKRAVDQLYEFGIAAWNKSSTAEHFSGGVLLNKKHSGRPTLWSHDRLLDLHAAVEREKAKGRLSTDRAALERVARTREWQRPASHRGSHQQWIETLEARNQEAKAFHRKAAKDLKEFKKIAQELFRKKFR